MGNVFDFDFMFSKAAVPSDSANIEDGQAVGLHVTGTSGFIKVTYASDDPSGTEVDDELYVVQGDYIKVPIKRVWSTVSGSPAATGVKVLYGKLRDAKLNIQ